MPALGWLLNLDFAGGVGIEAPTVPGLEFTLPTNRLHYEIPENRLHYTLPINRMHFTIPPFVGDVQLVPLQLNAETLTYADWASMTYYQWSQLTWEA